ncbi:tetratricopeptide repeat protein [Pseudosulfitobacter koreensis]|uniref:Tetratricopeptide repeat-containing protein n=1 Tax=Pseudosulfitobacter koreensis TaxID=2968472 RepID=A0ABT1Z3B5_9RHOB|nr:hypothetical protein [Pseudosulfitobacter koreense]MCR8827625.1 hypothetical protein [Pseudosulfitobacter koreense]
MTKDAKTIFTKKVESSGASIYELSNLALCYALEGDKSKASGYLESSIFLCDGQESHIIDLNRALIAYTLDNHESAKESLLKFRENHPKAFARYSKHSILINSAMSDLGIGI